MTLKAEIAQGIDGWSTKPLMDAFGAGSASGRSPECRRVPRDSFEVHLPGPN